MTTDDLGVAYAELTGLLLSEESLETTLQRVADLAVRVVDGCDACGVTVRQDGGYATAASTDQLARDVDDAQYAAGEGPCLDAIEHARTNRVDDCTAERRWSEFAGHAEERGILSFLAVPLHVRDQTIGALNLYSKQANGFDRLDEQTMQLFAGAAATTLANAQVYRSATALVEQMSDALESRAVIEQAKGVLVGQQQLAPDRAFEVLVLESQRSNRKLRDVAAAVVTRASGVAESATDR